MTPQRILYVNGGIMHRGGIESYMMSYYRNLDKDKLQIDFIVHGYDKGIYDDEIEAMGGRIFRVPVKSKNYFGNIRELRKIFDSNDYKIVHSHMDAMSTVVLKIAKESNIPIRIAHSHNTQHLTTNKIKYLLNEYARKNITKYATHLFACSEPAARWLFGSTNVDKGNVVYVKNAINLEEYAFDPAMRAKYREEFSVEEDLVIGHVGRFDYQKNHSYLIDVFNRLVQEVPNAKLVLVGDGRLKSKIQDKIIEYNLSNNIILLGVRDDVNNIMNAFDVFILPSHFEGLGIVLVEAQANGLKCIASDTIPKEVNISGDVTFLSTAQNNIGCWIRQILQTDVNNRNADINKFVTSGYGIKNEVEKLQQLYLEYLGDLI